MARTAAAVAPGTLVLGRYRPLRPLGTGGSGSVWLAREEGSGRDVALKIVAREGNAGSRAEREAAAAARLRHERCLRAYALARDRGHVYIVYEYVPGRTLRQVMRAGELDDRLAVECAAQVLEALAHAHRHGIVHRDVKPANALLADGPGAQVKLFDFGLAVMHEQETLTAAGDVPGTLAYISPERLRGRPASPAADIWAVGVFLWEALAGRHPFWDGSLLDTARRIEEGAPSLGSVRPDLPRALVECVDRCLAPDPRRRPRAEALVPRLRRAATTIGGEARRALPLRPRFSLGALPVRALPAGAAALFAGWSAATIPFFPAGWALGLAAVAAMLTLLRPRLGLAFALVIPIFPLGNYALSLAVLYAAAAAAWLVFSWRDPRRALVLVLGPLLGSIGALALLPLAGQLVRHPVRRAAHVVVAILAASAVAGAGRLSALGIGGSERPSDALDSLARALAADRGTLVLAAGFSIAALALPHARGRGPWPAAALGAFLIATAVVSTSAHFAISIVIAWIAAVLLVLEPRLRVRRRAEPEPPTVERVTVVQPLQPARGLAGPG